MDFYVKEEWRAPAAVGAVALAAGFGLGYAVCNRRWTKLGAEVVPTMEEAADLLEAQQDEIEQQRKLDFARAIGDAGHRGLIRTRPVPYQGEIIMESVEEEPDPEPEMAEEPDDGWNQQEEEENRSPDSPYVIHRDEFVNNPFDLTQLDLEYFARDNVLCDEKRVPIYNPTKVVGRLEFGRGSGDSNTVYVRNEKNSCEYAVTRVDGSYQMEVLGLEAEESADEEEEADLKHSAVRRFRMD